LKRWLKDANGWSLVSMILEWTSQRLMLNPISC